MAGGVRKRFRTLSTAMLMFRKTAFFQKIEFAVISKMLPLANIYIYIYKRLNCTVACEYPPPLYTHTYPSHISNIDLPIEHIANFENQFVQSDQNINRRDFYFKI